MLITYFIGNFAQNKYINIMTLYPKLIEEALATVIYPGTKKNLIESEMLADTPSINGMKVKVVLLFPRDTDPFLKSTVKAAEAAIHIIFLRMWRWRLLLSISLLRVQKWANCCLR